LGLWYQQWSINDGGNVPGGSIVIGDGDELFIIIVTNEREFKLIVEDYTESYHSPQGHVTWPILQG